MEEHRFGEETENIRLLGMQGKSHTRQEGEGALLDLGGRKRIWQRETVCSNKASSISSYQQNICQNLCQRVLKFIYAFHFHWLIQLQLAEHCSEQRAETLLKLAPGKVREVLPV